MTESFKPSKPFFSIGITLHSLCLVLAFVVIYIAYAWINISYVNELESAFDIEGVVLAAHGGDNNKSPQPLCVKYGDCELVEYTHDVGSLLPYWVVKVKSSDNSQQTFSVGDYEYIDNKTAPGVSCSDSSDETHKICKNRSAQDTFVIINTSKKEFDYCPRLEEAHFGKFAQLLTDEKYLDEISADDLAPVDYFTDSLWSTLDRKQEFSKEENQLYRWKTLCAHLALARHTSTINGRTHLFSKNTKLEKNAYLLPNAPHERESCESIPIESFKWYQPNCLYEQLVGLKFESIQSFDFSIARISDYFNVTSYLDPTLKPTRNLRPNGVIYYFQDSDIDLSNKSAIEQSQALGKLDRVIEKFLLDIKQLPETSMKGKIVAVNGGFQFMILVVALWCFLLLLIRVYTAFVVLKRNPDNFKDIGEQYRKDLNILLGSGNQKERRYLSLDLSKLHSASVVNSSGAIVDWLLDILPMLGFIGTVVGMIQAMGGVGDVVSATPGPELNSTMGAMSDSLMLAFVTTALALGASLLLALLKRVSISLELNIVDNLPMQDANLYKQEKKQELGNNNS